MKKYNKLDERVYLQLYNKLDEHKASTLINLMNNQIIKASGK